MKREELERQFSGEEAILDSGSNKRELYVVCSGNVMLEPNDGGEPRLLGPGEIFGEMGAVLGELSPYGVRADGDASVLLLTPVELNQLCRESPDFSARLILHLAQELANVSAGRAVSPEDGRLRDGFAALVPVLFKRRSGERLPAPISGRLADLASDAGLTVLEAYFCIQTLLERRYLQLVEDQLTLVEADALRELGG
ncbi:MAG: cyclic nucleotide-binding domain-containing protein [Deltaproteobacteria bacterium]|nr:cyclic nucleotide-binding domain-containing protein [Deltaproteobacteria bacterium]